MKQYSLSRASGKPTFLDLTTLDGERDEPVLDLDRARAFYRAHAEEVVARMRHPSAPTNNIAAVMVAEFETNPRVRAEATEALEAARRAREARRALDTALAAYDPRPRA